MARPVLQVLDAGQGTTPPCPGAFFHVRQVVLVKGHRKRGFAAVAAVVPPGFPAEYALADECGSARPLMITPPRRCVSYIVGFQGDRTPQLFNEGQLEATDEPDANVSFEGDTP